ncbi:FkbM family methyltransferase [Pedobacter montanisoli]|uniref:FkbM family methyltransferase n=1 Tax=Pedobacter montanisoli TaxID=2923277 RepID=A0ABS9ZVW9_9SPHI|nr:FkbM family methyltransferase [Pedobacter montanisoli]MCJ0742448.1 FkbM family methyltransferase [Pedobacter montanisoli]
MDEGYYEEKNIALMRSLIKANTTVFDIGANIGLMSIPILASINSVKVISVEASPNSFPFLAKTHRLSDFQNRWTILNKAVFNYEGEISFKLTHKNNAAYESILDTKRCNFTDTIQVECTTLDKIWEDLDKQEVSFIKIDIEGADLPALQGAINCITHCKPVILMEWNKENIIPFQLKNTDLLSFIKKINYTLYTLPYFNKCEDITDLELFSNIYENFLLLPNKGDEIAGIDYKPRFLNV